jgi:hypothetical protein
MLNIYTSFYQECCQDKMKLSRAKLEDLLERLRQAEALISGVRTTYLDSGDVTGARLLDEIVNLLSDEIAAG